MDNTSIKNNQKNNHFLFYSATITINTIFGLQILNSYVSLLNNFLRERPNISLIQVGIYAIVTFMLVFLAGILFMIFTKKALILLFAAGLCAVRLIIQVNSWAPLSLAASALGTVLWMVSIVFFISLVQEKKISLFYEFFPALFLGFAATTGIYGMFGTWDLIWQDNAASYFLVFSFAAAYLWLTVKISPDFGKSRQYFDGGMNVFYTLIVFMPFVFLQLYRFQNIAALSAVLGFNTLTGFAVIAATNILTFSIIYLFVLKLEGSKNVSSWLQNLLTAAAFLMAVLSFWPEAKGGKGSFYISQVVIGNISSWWLFFVVIKSAALKHGVRAGEFNSTELSSTKFDSTEFSRTREANRSASWKNISAFGISGILFFIFAFIYYGSYDMKLPFENWMIPLITAVLLGVCAQTAASLESMFFRKGKEKEEEKEEVEIEKGQQEEGGGEEEKGEKTEPSLKVYKKVYEVELTGIKKIKLMPFYFLLLTLIFPLIFYLPVKNNPEISVRRDSIRIMDYNIHQGFNIYGYLDLEGIARVIEGSGADIAALQEVSRGWVVNGSADTYEWLAERLGMKYRLFMPASDQVWGNAILSKYPLKLLESGFLPRLDAPLRRSFLLAEVELVNNSGVEKNINILCTHIHHVKGEGFIREEHVKTILDAWGGLERTAIMGDFNARSHEPEILMMHDAGLIDSQAALGKEDRLTWIHYEPFERIDYIWATPDIKILNLFVPYSTASDHLPVVVDIN